MVSKIEIEIENHQNMFSILIIELKAGNISDPVCTTYLHLPSILSKKTIQK